MKEVRKINDFGYVVKRSDRKSIGITIERDGSVTVRSPFFVPADEINRFVSNKRIWIQQKLSEKALLSREKPRREFVNGQGFLYLGRSYRLRYVDGNRASMSPKGRQGLALCLKNGYFELDEARKESARRHFVSWYTQKTEEKLRERIPRYDKRIGVKVERFRVSSLGHRWASLSRNKVINFNWRSVMAPIWVFDYILVHEMVHMIEKPHSRRFWQIISRVIPDYEEHVRWLAENGRELEL